MGQEVTPWFSKEFEPNPAWFTTDSGQQSRVRLRPTISGYRRLKDPKVLTEFEWFVKVDLGETTVYPGDMTWNREDKRGYFTHGAYVRMGMEPGTGWVMSWDSPGSTQEGGSASESKSTQYSVGFFGESPMATYSGSISSGVGQSFPDFEILNNSAKSVGDEFINHRYELRLVEGAKYQNPTNLVDAPYSLQGRVRGLTPRAISNLKISSMGLFHNANPKPQTNSTLTIEVTHHLVAVEKTWATAAWAPFMSSIRVVYGFDATNDAPQRTFEGIFGGMVLKDTFQAKNRAKWQFDVDMNIGTVALRG